MTYQLTIEPLGAMLEIEHGQTLLDASLRQGIYIPHACGHGLCGTCKVDILEGEVDHGNANPFALMDFEREGGKALACCATLQSDAVIEADIDEDPDARVIPVNDFLGTVTDIQALTPTIKAIHLKLQAPITFQAGQYIKVNLPASNDTRAFSIANPPDAQGQADRIELNVRLVPGGAGTTWLHQQLTVGDQINISGPYGRFFVRRSANRPVLFMAGGSGLSSPLSMILDLLQSDCRQPITLFYGQRIREELYYDDKLRELAAQHPNFQYVPALSDEPADSDWQGARGYVHDVAHKHMQGDFAGRKAYLCGPPLMIEACIGTLMKGRLFERDIYAEKFLSAADADNTRSALFRRL